MAANIPGKVFIVGAGPGDPDLLTLKGERCIAAADVIVHDRLVNPVLLQYASSRAELIYAGKQPRMPCADQRKIEAILIQHARAGKIVVRLKGGDPFVFGRGGEEAEALKEAGIDYEIVPGISSAIAAPRLCRNSIDSSQIRFERRHYHGTRSGQDKVARSPASR